MALHTHIHKQDRVLTYHKSQERMADISPRTTPNPDERRYEYRLQNIETWPKTWSQKFGQ